ASRHWKDEGCPSYTTAMGIPVYFGWDFRGHLEQPDGSAIATRCFYIYFFPLIPLGTYRVWQLADGKYSGTLAPFSFKSLFAAFFKAWGFWFATFALIWTGV